MPAKDETAPGTEPTIAASGIEPTMAASGIEPTMAASGIEPTTSGIEPTIAASGASGIEPTIAASGASARAATMAASGASGIEPTMAASSGIAPTMAPQPSVDHAATLSSGAHASPAHDSAISQSGLVRAGGADHERLVTVERSHYRLYDELARGGMGRILRARDRRLGREVAIKELLGASPELRARFEREARITARLQHPAIVNIYEAGVFPDGEPFYAMKLVAGESFDKVIRKTPKASRMALLPTVLAVADALAYAHSNRIIHRDLKPHNILVGEFGETVVIDWGLTKDLAAESDIASDVVRQTRAVEHTDDSQTVDGSVMGTPAFMPVEQAEGEAVDERADVYAIGAILYNVLAGAAPYTGKSAHDVLAEVLRAPPKQLAAVAPDAPEDLIAIVDKAMARDKSDRYPTARELADDLRRYTTGQLVGAHRYTSWQLVRRWMRRHRAVLAVAGVLLTALAVVGIVSVRAVIEEKNVAQSEREKAEAASVVAREKETEARTQRAGAEKLADFLLVHMKDRLEPLGRLELMKGVGASVVDYYKTIPAAESNDDQLRQRADALLVLADVDNDAGDLAAAKRGFETVGELRRVLSARRAHDLEAAYGIAQTEERLGTLARTRQDLARTEQHYKAAIEVVAQLVAKAPDNVKYKRAAALFERLTGELRVERGDLAGGLTFVDKARAGLEPLAEIDDRSATFLHDTYRVLAQIHDKRGDLAASEKALAQSVERARKSASREPVDYNWVAMKAQATSELGRWLADHGRPADALPILVETRVTWDSLVKHDPDNNEWVSFLAQTHSDLGVAYQNAGRDADAMASFQQALAIRQRASERAPDDMRAAYNTSASHERIALLLLARGDLAGAERHFVAGATVIESLHAKDPSNVELARSVGVVAEQRGEIALARGKVDDAIAFFEKSQRMSRELGAKDPNNVQYVRDLVEANNKLARAQLRKGNGVAATATNAEGVTQARRAVTMASDQSDVLAVALLAAGQTAQTLGRSDDAAKLAREAAEIATRDLAAHPQDVDRATTLVEADTLLAQILSKTDVAGAKAAVARATERLASIEKAGRVSKRVAAVRTMLNETAQRIGR